MDALSNALQPHKEFVGQVASYVTILQFFSGILLCRDIHRKGTSKGVSPMPFIGGLALGILFLKYGLVLNDPATIQVNLVAVALNMLYTVFFYIYAEDKYTEVYKPTSYAVALLAILLGYTEIERAENLEFRFGLIMTVLMLGLLGAPLADVREIIEKKDASKIPLPITLMGAIVTFLWLIYGIILKNNFMIVQNVVGCALCVLQLVLVALYPGEDSAGQSKKKKSVKKE